MEQKPIERKDVEKVIKDLSKTYTKTELQIYSKRTIEILKDILRTP